MEVSRKIPALGIDLGTTTSMACIHQRGQRLPGVIKHHPRGLTDWMRSVFCMTENGPLVGEEAWGMLRDARYHRDVIRCVKRYMARDIKLFPRHAPQFSPVEVSAYILKHLRRAAERQLGYEEGEITEAVITVPAYFGQRERHNTRLAAAQAGFDMHKVRLLDEPIAAAVGLEIHRQAEEQLVLVIDLGGGTFDVTLLQAGANVGSCGFQELGRIGHDKLGGIDWDTAVAKLVFFEHDLDREPEYLEPDNIELFDPCEAAKVRFCTNQASQSESVTFFDEPTRQHFDTRVERSAFLRETNGLAALCGRICDHLLEEIPESDLSEIRRTSRNQSGQPLKRVTWNDIDRVYMVGGGSLVPAVQEEIARRWGRPPEIATKPQHQVAFGAARCAASLSHENSLFAGAPLRSPHTLGYLYYPEGPEKTGSLQPIVKRNERLAEKSGRTVRVPVAGGGSRLRVRFAEQRVDFRENKAEVVEIGEIVLTDLPATADEKSIRITLECPDQREMYVTAEFRGRSKQVNLNEPTSFGPNGKE